jgi:hypothetical protein
MYPIYKSQSSIFVNAAHIYTMEPISASEDFPEHTKIELNDRRIIEVEENVNTILNEIKYCQL